MGNLSDLLMPVVIALIMYGIGLNLRFRDFMRVFLRPKAILLGLSSQILLLPAVAFLLAWLMPIEPIYKAGIVLIASAPGGTASNLVTHMLRGRTALSVSLTSLNSFSILLTIPLFVSLALAVFVGRDTEIEIGVGDTFKEILLTVVVPVIAGVLTNEFGPQQLLARLRQPLRYILPGLLLGIFALALFVDDSDQPAAFARNLNLFIPLLVLNLITMLIGFGIARRYGIKHDGCYTIAVEMGLQNSALAIYIASNVLGSSEMALVAVIYSSFSFFSTWFVAWLFKHKLKPDKPKLLL